MAWHHFALLRWGGATHFDTGLQWQSLCVRHRLLDLQFRVGDASPVFEKAALETKYKEELDEAFGIKFNNLFTITNMPIKVSTNPATNDLSVASYCILYTSGVRGIAVSFLHHETKRLHLLGAALCGLPVPEGRAAGVHGAAGPQLQRGGMQRAHVQVSWALLNILSRLPPARCVGSKAVVTCKASKVVSCLFRDHRSARSSLSRIVTRVGILRKCSCFFTRPHRDTINVGWDGRIFDCDFNQQLELGMGTAGTNAGASEKLRSVQVGTSDLLYISCTTRPRCLGHSVMR